MDIKKLKKLTALTKKLNLLYVEDNEEIRKQTLKMLQHFFTHIDTAVDGMDGLEKYQTYYQKNHRYYDVVVSDINMPKMNGVEMSEKIKRINTRQNIIVLSAFNDGENLDACIAFGVTSYLHKPIDLHALMDTLEMILEVDK